MGANTDWESSKRVSIKSFPKIIFPEIQNTKGNEVSCMNQIVLYYSIVYVYASYFYEYFYEYTHSRFVSSYNII